MRYTYSDEDEDDSEATNRRSARNTGTNTPADAAAPTVTLSGRQVRSRHGGMYGETVTSGVHMSNVAVREEHGSGVDDEDEDADITSRRPRRAAANNGRNARREGANHIDGYNTLDELDNEDDDISEQDYGDDEEDGHVPVETGPDDDEDDDEALTADDDDMDVDDVGGYGTKKSLVVVLNVRTPTPERKDPLTGVDKSSNEATDSIVPLVQGPDTQPDVIPSLEDDSTAGKIKPETRAPAEAPNDTHTGGAQSTPSEDMNPSGGQPIHLSVSHSLPYLNNHGKNYPFSPSIDVSTGGL